MINASAISLPSATASARLDSKALAGRGGVSLSEVDSRRAPRPAIGCARGRRSHRSPQVLPRPSAGHPPSRPWLRSRSARASRATPRRTGSSSSVPIARAPSYARARPGQPSAHPCHVPGTSKRTRPVDRGRRVAGRMESPLEPLGRLLRATPVRPEVREPPGQSERVLGAPGGKPPAQRLPHVVLLGAHAIEPLGAALAEPSSSAVSASARHQSRCRAASSSRSPSDSSRSPAYSRIVSWSRKRACPPRSPRTTSALSTRPARRSTSSSRSRPAPGQTLSTASSSKPPANTDSRASSSRSPGSSSS